MSNKNFEEFDFNKVCRTCLSSGGELISIFDCTSTNLCLGEMLTQCTSVKFYVNNMPSQICHDCVRGLYQSYEFAIKCKESDEKLQLYLKNKYNQEIKHEVDYDSNSIQLLPEDNENNEPIDSPTSTGIRNNDSSIETCMPHNLFNSFVLLERCDESELRNLALLNSEAIPKYKRIEENSVNTNSLQIVNNTNPIDNASSKETCIPPNCFVLLERCDESELINMVLPNSKAIPNDQKSTDIKLECTICEVFFTSNDHFKRHMKYVHERKKPTCTICGKFFNSKFDLSRHMIVHVQQSLYSCNICGEHFKEECNFSAHMLKHNTEEQSSNDQDQDDVVLQNKLSNADDCQNDRLIFEPSNIDIKDFLQINIDANSSISDNILLNNVCNTSESDRSNIEECESVRSANIDSQNPSNCKMYGIRKRNLRAQLYVKYNDESCRSETSNSDQCQSALSNYTDFESESSNDEDYEDYQNEYPFVDNYNSNASNNEISQCKRTNIIDCPSEPSTIEYVQCNQIKTEDTQNELLRNIDYNTEDNERNQSNDDIKIEPPCNENGQTEGSNTDNCEREQQSKETHTNTKKRHKCLVCAHPFRKLTDLTEHMKVHNGKNPFTCSFCGKIFFSPQTLRIHMQSHDDDKPYSCTKCDLKFSCKQYLHAHEKVHMDEKRHKCKVCSRLFRKAANMRIHMKIHSGKKKSYSCSICEKSFFKKSNYDDHMYIHNTKTEFPCPICNRCFKTKAQVTTHLYVHSGEDSICSVCGKKFASKQHLNAHFATHAVEKLFACKICGNSYKSQRNLGNHLRRVHPKGELVTCAICKRSFKHIEILHKHMRTHSAEKPHQCTFCDKSFRLTESLKIHIRTHTNERPYSCKVCTKPFKSQSNLHLHMRTHNDERRYPCELCDFKFKIKHHLTAHIERKHP